MFSQGQLVFLGRINKRLRSRALWAVITLGFIAAFCGAQSTSSPPTEYLAGSLGRDEPQAVYAADVKDSWNRIFYCLFTRTVQTRLSDDFQSATPFHPVEVMGLPHLTASTRTFARIESGDHAIEPLDPLFFRAQPSLQVFNEPRYSQLESALTEALEEQPQRSSLHRALMQSDAWAAYDILARNTYFEGEEGKQQQQRQSRLLQLLARFIKKLALTSGEINALPDNYASAVKKRGLPDLFAAKSDWMEIQWLPHRDHDRASHYRRAARVFIKPGAPLQNEQDKRRLLDALRSQRLNERKLLDSVALVVQNLLINAEGKVVPTPLTYGVQLRRLAQTEGDKAEMEVYELSRQWYLTDPQSGGLKNKRGPAYLPTSGNDFTFASSHTGKNGVSAPILAPLRSRCVSCHGDNLQVVMTLSQHFLEGMDVPPIRQLNPLDNDHIRYVSEQKMQREDFKKLLKQWPEATP